MRIALFANTFFPRVGGAEKQLDLLASGLVKRGHEPHVIAPTMRGQEKCAPTLYPVHRYPRIWSKRYALRYQGRIIWKLHRMHAFDLVHAHGAYPAAYMVKDFAQKQGIPLVIRAYGADILPGEFISSDQRLKARMQRALAAADLLIAQNQELAGLLGELSGHPERVFQLPNGVELDEHASDILFQQEPPFALALSHLYAKKGLDVLIRAWRKVCQTFPHAMLKIAGSGPERAALEELVRAQGLSSRIEFCGTLRDEAKARQLRGCHVFVNSARREPFSNATLEAIAAGCQVVVTNTGGHPEIIENTGAGWLVEPGDESALAAALVEVFKQPKLVLTEKLRRERIACYSVDRMIDRYVEQVERFVGSTARLQSI